MHKVAGLRKSDISSLSTAILNGLIVNGELQDSIELPEFGRTKILAESSITEANGKTTLDISVNFYSIGRKSFAEVGAEYAVVNGSPVIEQDTYYVILGFDEPKRLWKASTETTTSADVYNEVCKVQPAEFKRLVIGAMLVLEQVELDFLSHLEGI